MKVAHSAVVTPHKAGLYETAHDLVIAERKQGIDARIIDPIHKSRGVERGAPIAGPEFLGECDVVVNHSGLSKTMNQTKLPIIHVLHGRPYGSFLLEHRGRLAIYSHWTKIAGDPRYKKFVTFWPEFIPYFANVLPTEKLQAITAPVDLEQWTPDGPNGYDFHGHKGEINIVCADIWREDKDPYHVVNAFMLFAKSNPGAKLHIYAAPQKGTAWEVLKSLLRAADALGECVGFIKGLEYVYRAADLLITPHRIATRSVRESLASGCKVVMAPGNKYTPYIADPEDLVAYAAAMGRALKDKRNNSRQMAKKYFDSSRTARQFVEIIQEVIDG